MYFCLIVWNQETTPAQIGLHYYIYITIDCDLSCIKIDSLTTKVKFEILKILSYLSIIHLSLFIDRVVPVFFNTGDWLSFRGSNVRMWNLERSGILTKLRVILPVLLWGAPKTNRRLLESPLLYYTTKVHPGRPDWSLGLGTIELLTVLHS